MKRSLILALTILLAAPIPLFARDGADIPRSCAKEGYDFVVDAAGAGDFRTMQEAVDAMPYYGKGRRIDIFVRNGTYREKVSVHASRHNLRFVGESAEGVIITWGDYAAKPALLGAITGTSGTATVYVHASDVTFERITFENSAGPVGQAVAVMITGDRVQFRSCRFLGFQDTLYTYGPGTRHYFEDCYIEGTVDFIFGFATAAFYRCTIRSKDDAFITAAGTPKECPWGYLFVECRLEADPGVTRVYLGRPWRDYARTLFIDCWMGPQIAPEGWDNWDRPEAEKSVCYAESESTGPGGTDLSQRVPWARVLTAEEAMQCTIPNALAGSDNWNPQQESGSGEARHY